jgi:hypothetical protein
MFNTMNQKSENTIYKGIMAAFLILIMHVLLIGSIGVMVLFFYGIINHSIWMVIAITCFFSGAVWIVRRIRESRAVINNVTGNSLKGKTIEVSFLGGIANFKISDSQNNLRITQGPTAQKQIPSSTPDNIRTLAELADLYEKKLITPDEYSRAKKKFFE